MGCELKKNGAIESPLENLNKNLPYISKMAYFYLFWYNVNYFHLLCDLIKQPTRNKGRDKAAFLENEQK